MSALGEGKDPPRAVSDGVAASEEATGSPGARARREGPSPALPGERVRSEKNGAQQNASVRVGDELCGALIGCRRVAKTVSGWAGLGAASGTLPSPQARGRGLSTEA